ncbi:hypothetical protein ScPMuIL_018310 [Solemya velum]
MGEVNARMSRRMLLFDDQLKIAKLRTEKAGVKKTEGDNGVDDLKRKVFLLEKDLAYIENEFYSHEKTFAVIIAGMKDDIRRYSANPSEESKTLESIFKVLDLSYDSAIESQITKAKATLPVHYKMREKDIKVDRKRLKKLSTAVSVVRMGHQTDKEGSNDIKESKTEQKKNPEIVNEASKQVNVAVAKTHFPQMSEYFILEMWSQFKSFDRNGDGILDLPEIMKSFTSLGFDFSAEQVKEAMVEVDEDNNETTDFYEFLVLVDKIDKSTGKCDILKTGLKDKHTDMSKVCAIQ